ncbi:MAG: hypothetical protein AMK72_11930 [Planctomycetes bacterium SM23_25]|nr:MAG: hypothetical protein AMK72_11930 [Planctomycetes bacterium SM23_25]
MQPLEEISPWLIRARRILYWLAVLMIFTLRLNYAAHRRGLVALWIAFVAMVFVAFPAGAVGAFVAPVVAFLIADVVAAIQRGTRFRPRLDLIAVLAVAVLGGMLLLMIRGKRFRSLEDMVDYVLGNPQVVSTKLFEKTGEHHLIVSESVGYCLQNFGRRQEFLWLHTPYSILVNPIPRELWPGKPLAFGRALAQIWRDEFGVPGVPVVGPSYAAGLAGEGYANGGWAGVVLLSAVVGYLCGKAAKYALIGLFTPSYPIVMVGLALFRFSIVFVRGDMLSAWTMTVYPLVVLVFGLALADRILRKAARDAVSPVDRRASGGGPP